MNPSPTKSFVLLITVIFEDPVPVVGLAVEGILPAGVKENLLSFMGSWQKTCVVLLARKIVRRIIFLIIGYYSHICIIKSKRIMD